MINHFSVQLNTKVSKTICTENLLSRTETKRKPVNIEKIFFFYGMKLTKACSYGTCKTQNIFLPFTKQKSKLMEAFDSFFLKLFTALNRKPSMDTHTKKKMKQQKTNTTTILNVETTNKRRRYSYYRTLSGENPTSVKLN